MKRGMFCSQREAMIHSTMFQTVRQAHTQEPFACGRISDLYA